MSTLGQVYLDSTIKRLLTYKILGEKTIAQLEEKDLHFSPDPGSNSIAIIIRHMSGNMTSRWTDFLTTDGEKEGRDRDKEFSLQHPPEGREALLDLWEKGWNCLLDALLALNEDDLLQTIHIRHEPLSAIDAINRQLTHYPYHVGQIVYIGKTIKGQTWNSLSIARGRSDDFNRNMKERRP